MDLTRKFYVKKRGLRFDFSLYYYCTSFIFSWLGLYLTAGEGKNELKDPIKEHAKMHELGIAHKHDK